MEYGIYYAYWTRTWSIGYEEYLGMVEKAAAMGFDILEVSAVDLMGMDGAQLGELRRRAAANSLILTAGSGLTPAFDVSAEDPGTRRAGIESLKRTFAQMERAGVRKLCGMMHCCWPADYSRPIDKPAARARSLESMRQNAKNAADHGIALMLEVCNRYEHFLLNTSREATDYVAELGAENVKIMLDSFHMNIEEDAIGDAVRYANRHLGHLHLGECNRKVPGQGRFSWEELAAALRDIDYQGAAVMEPFVLTGCPVGDDIRLWRDLSNNADEPQLDRDLAAALAFLRSAFA